MSATDAVNALSEENIQDERTPKTRKTKARSIDRAREESEAITKDLGPEIEGRRRTRSAAKGIPATPPPPAKKEKKTPVPKSDGKPKGRGRPRKNASVSEEEAVNDDASKDEIVDKNDTDEKEEKDDKPAAAAAAATTAVSENNTSHDESKDEASNNNGDSDAAKGDKQKTVATENGEKETETDATDKPEEKKPNNESKAGEVSATAAE